MSGTRRLFGTDGIRGRANIHPMTGEVMFELGRALALAFQLSPREPGERRVLIGKDTRRSGYMLEDALAAGLCSMGVHVLHVGPMPTPGLAFLTADMRCDAGAMISASHNAFEDNGVKFFSRDGFKLPDTIESKIESLMYSEELEACRPVGADIGRAHRIDDAAGRYIVFLKKTFPKELSLDGLRIAIDCAHGAAYKVAPTVLEELGAEVIPLGAAPNGTNINEECGALHPEVVAESVVHYRADLGIALDGDADRVIFPDVNQKRVFVFDRRTAELLYSFPSGFANAVEIERDGSLLVLQLQNPFIRGDSSNLVRRKSDGELVEVLARFPDSFWGPFDLAVVPEPTAISMRLTATFFLWLLWVLHKRSPRPAHPGR